MATDFAVVKINTKQYLVEKDTRFTIDSVAVGSPIEVIMAGTGEEVSIGEPVLSDFGVKLQVVSEGKGDKLIVRRYKSKSRYRKNKGHRQPISTLVVMDLGKKVKNELVWETPQTVTDGAKGTKATKPKAEKVEENPKSKEK